MVQFQVERGRLHLKNGETTNGVSFKTPPSSPKIPERAALSRSESPSFRSTSLRSNLTREQVDRDPLFYYEVVKTLGVGSMGSVAKVRKRQNVVGGSARKEIQDAFRRQKRNKECLQIPFFGWFLRFCIDTDLKQEDSIRLTNSNRNTSGNSLFGDNSPKPGGSKTLISRTSSLLRPAGLWVDGSEHADDSSDEEYGLLDSANSTGSNSEQNTYAMKSIHLSRVTDDSFIMELKNEIDILKKLDHPHIVRAMETFEHRNQIFIVMELCQGGDLYSRDPYTEEEAARIIGSILSAISYMHEFNIAHRDLKYENILFVSDHPKSEIKLIDFGLSKVYGDNAQLTDGVGTIYTMAPEVLKGNYSQTADIWSIGVIAYMLLSSQMPFYGRKRRHIVEQILNCQYDFRGRRWKRISNQAKDFVRDLLVLDPDERCTCQEASRASWLNRRFAATTRAPHAEEEDDARNAMVRYAGYTKLKKMALMVVAHKSSTEEIGILRKVFQKFDSRRDGSISYEEFCEALSHSGHCEEDLRDMFDAVDLDGSGRIRYTEFLAATIEAQGAISEERLAEAFDRLDSDDSGYISAENLAEMLGKDFPQDEIDVIIKEADLTKDNRISYSEFLALWEDKNEAAREDALRELGDTVSNFTESSRSISVEGASSSDSRHAAAEARASFIQQKHRDIHEGDKHVNFVDKIEFADSVESTTSDL